MFEWFVSIPAQVQSAWITGALSIITTPGTVFITQYFAKKGLDKTLANQEANFAKQYELQQEQFDANDNRERLRHKNELEAKKLDRLYQKKYEAAVKMIEYFEDYRDYIHQYTDKEPLENYSKRAARFRLLFSKNLYRKSQELAFIGIEAFINGKKFRAAMECGDESSINSEAEKLSNSKKKFDDYFESFLLILKEEIDL